MPRNPEILIPVKADETIFTSLSAYPVKNDDQDQAM
jgi:hypothetical protein